jgi:hypothetical protein
MKNDIYEYAEADLIRELFLEEINSLEQIKEELALG